MSEIKFIQYGDKKMPMGNLTLEQAKATMARFFPELADPKIETKKRGDETVYVFTKQAGRKGIGARTATRRRRAVRRTPLQRIAKNLRALKPVQVIPPATLDYAAGKTPYVFWQDEKFLSDESAATEHALFELASLEPRIEKVSIL